jgi:hypothetical protein
VAPRGRPASTVTGGKGVEIDILAGPGRLRRLNLAVPAD